jgi:hypothetical protein
MSREAMQLALELIEPIAHNSTDDPRGKAYEAITALRQALETEQEPFEYWNAVEGWVKIDEVREHFDAVGCGTIYKSAGEGRSPLYTAPPKKQWVSLTDQEVWQAIDNVLEGGGWLDVARVLEQAFKEKNT